MNFSSNNSVNVNNILDRNVRVKIEPGTSSSDSGLVKNIKMEPGLPTTTQRLTSYRLPRDLTLGGSMKTEKPRKVYMPNLNAQRIKKKDEPVTPKVEPTKSKDSGQKDRGRERGRGDRGRGKGSLVQSVGVWSEGTNAPLASKRVNSSGNSCTGTRKYQDKAKINKVNKIEDEKLKNLSLEDDPVDDNMDPDAEADYIMLPMNKNHAEQLCKQEVKVKIDAHADKSNVDRKPIISESGEVIDVKTEYKVKVEKEEEDPSKGLLEIIENSSNSYVLLQLPSCLPGLKCNDDKEEPKPKRPNDSRLTTSASDKEKPVPCIMSDLKSGLVGKLEILKSGKVRLRLGDNYLLVHAGSRFATLQHLLAAKVDTSSLTGEIVNLGPVTDNLLCSVWYNNLLGKVRE